MRTIPLTRGQVAIVDDGDFDQVNQFKWHALKRPFGFHAARNSYEYREGERVRKYQYLHQFLLGTRGDHRNGDKLDCRRENLRPATQMQNNRAFRQKSLGKSSQYRGVFWDKSRDLWGAAAHVLGKRHYLGRFECEEDAARAYDKAAKELFGEFAAPNFP